MVDEKYLANDMGGSILPVGMAWNYIRGIGIESNRCFQGDPSVTKLRCFSFHEQFVRIPIPLDEL